MASSAQTWACGVCTLENEPLHLQCAACLSHRPSVETEEGLGSARRAKAAEEKVAAVEQETVAGSRTRGVCLNRVRDDAEGGEGLVSFRELVQSSRTSGSLRRALVTAMVVDEAFLSLHFAPSLPLLIVQGSLARSAADSFECVSLARVGLPCWRRLTVQLTEGRMHAKLCVLEFERVLRVVISSSNLTDEWECVRQSAWWRDFERVEPGVAAVLPPFAEQLVAFLEALRVPSEFIGLAGFDWRDTADVFLVASVPGRAPLRSGEPRFGLARLREVLSALPAWAAPPGPLFVQSASLGNLAMRSAARRYRSWVHEFCCSAAGPAPAGEAAQSAAPAQDKQQPSLLAFFGRKRSAPEASVDESAAAQPPAKHARAAEPLSDPSSTALPQLRIIFPSHQSVAASSQQGVDVVTLQSKWWGLPGFPRDAFVDWAPRVRLRAGARQPIQHNKVLFRTLAEPASAHAADASGLVAWIYVGSHNLSRMAWGGAADSDALTFRCHSYELGVVLATSDPAVASAWQRVLPNRLDALRSYGADWQAKKQGASGDSDSARPYTAGGDHFGDVQRLVAALDRDNS